MTKQVRRIFVEKQAAYAVEAKGLYADLRRQLGLRGLRGVRIVHRYDIAGVQDAAYEAAKQTIFAEATVDVLYEETLTVDNAVYFAVEYLPGQYDQRADSAAQCVQMLTGGERPLVRTAKVIILEGNVTDEELAAIKKYCINPVEAREAALLKPASLEEEMVEPAAVAVLTGFTERDAAGLRALHQELGLAMSEADLAFCQNYFRDTERRNPTITEIKVIDTYWSDHCRHTTFLTAINGVEWEEHALNRPVQQAYEAYLEARRAVYGSATNRDVCLMDIAVMGMKALRQQGKLPGLDESEEINACSIVVPVERDGQTEDWLVMFKNETHNHPTEIEPFGGAATCLGGAIRDPLSGRSYVYQAMRVTGSADPRTALADTLPGKLPQRQITVGAAAGYSSYGNQIGLATGQVAETYHPGFVAKRMEIGAVIAAAPRDAVVRLRPAAGDVIVLLGGRTGRDGCGGATGSSKEHDEESLLTCGAEVQKGNAPTERKLQRLFRNPRVSRMIKRCNDFGAGGVSVAIGELADGLCVNLDAVPKKYEGLDGTELAISESQERMAVVIAAADVAAFTALAGEENVEATVVAEVTELPRLRMEWRGQRIVDVSREFLNTNGVKQEATVRVAAPQGEAYFAGRVPAGTTSRERWLNLLQDVNVCSQKGLVERFDSSIGAGSVLMPFGGKRQLTPAEGMAATIPVLEGTTATTTLMSYGYQPYLGEWSPFHGGLYAVVESVAKIVAMGGAIEEVYLTLQEYFEKLGTDPQRWGKPFSALLGAFYAQRELGVAAIGGKDSMSGTFKDLTVPPTLVSFAVGISTAQRVVSPEFKAVGSQLVWLPVRRDAAFMPDFAALLQQYRRVAALTQDGQVLAAHTVRTGGLAAAVSKMAFGNGIGAVLDAALQEEELFRPDHGALLLELPAELPLAAALAGCEYRVIGYTQAKAALCWQDLCLPLAEAEAAWIAPLETIFATQAEAAVLPELSDITVTAGKRHHAQTFAKPRVLIPVFPGTNCEYDTARAFAAAGAETDIMVIRNLTPAAVQESTAELARRIAAAQMIMLPGGFSAGDEPDGSGKFIATMFRSPAVKDAVRNLLQQRDGLMLGICNGFQALIKLGLVPYGDIVDIDAASPTLTYNAIGRHVSCMVQTKIVSTLSPWLQHTSCGEIHTLPVSHGEGRFIASEALVQKLWANGQIATQYVDASGQASALIPFNPNASIAAIEGITSPDGRVFGKMAHSERFSDYTAKNVPGNQDQRLFAAGVAYFK